jgi:hypothetical protein
MWTPSDIQRFAGGFGLIYQQKPYEPFAEHAIIREIPRKVKDLSGTFPGEAQPSAASRTA